MASNKRVLVLTRPDAQSRSFLKDCESALGRPLDAIVSPIFRIEPLGHETDLNRYKTLIVTSQNALSDSDFSGRHVVTVGHNTAQKAKSLGAHAMCLGETVDALIERADVVESPALYLRGKHTRGDLAKHLKAQGSDVDEVIVYDQVAQPMSEAARRALEEGFAVVPIFSPRTATLVSENSVHPDTCIVAISAATAAAWQGNGAITVAERPDSDAMQRLVLAAL